MHSCYIFYMGKFRTILVLLLLFSWVTMNPAHAGKRRTLENCDAPEARTDNHLALACNIYWEASNQSIDGQLAVAFVTMHRVLSPKYPNTFAEVVWQYKLSKRSKKKIAQFSWTLDGKPDTVHSKRGWKKALEIASLFTVPREKIIDVCPTVKLQWVIDDHVGKPRRPLAPCPQATMLQQVRLATMMYHGEDNTGGALFYHANYVQPWWSKPRYKLVQTAIIDDHIFYTPRYRAVTRYD